MNEHRWGTKKQWAVIFLLSLLTEVFIFNARSFELIGCHEKSRGVTVSAEEMRVAENGQVSFEIRGKERIPGDLRTVRVEFPNLDLSAPLDGVIHTDETNLLLGHDREVRLVPGIAHSQNVYLYPGFRVHTLRFYFDLAEPTEAVVTFNAPLPLELLPLRIVLLFLLFGFLWVFRPNAPIWKAKMQWAGYRGEVIIAVIWVLFLLWTDLSTYPNPMKSMKVHPQVERNSRQQYELLTEALYHGSLALLVDPPAALADIENPYDQDQRMPVIEESLWDVAYYGGRYYVYYGLVPAALLMLPIRALTGKSPALDFVVWFYAVAGSVALMGLYRLLMRRWFRNVGKVSYYIGLVLLLLSACLLGCVRRPLAYETALTAAFAHVTWGLFLIYDSLLNKRAKYRAELMLGCLLLALAVGCRPTALFYLFATIPLMGVLWERNGRSQKRLAGTLLLCALPFVTVGAVLAAYNYARFGNPLEFGQNFNLSKYDNRGLNSGLLLPNYLMSIWNFIIGSGLQLMDRFPFVRPAERILFAYGGTKDFHNVFPLFWFCPWIILIPVMPFLKRPNDARGWLFRGIGVMFPLVSLLIGGFSGTMVGIIQRYSVDFFWPMALCALSAYFLMEEWAEDDKPRLLLRGLLMVSLFCALFVSAGTWVGEANHLNQSWLEFNNPILFEKLNAFFAFWL